MFTENKTTELKREYVDDIKNTAIGYTNKVLELIEHMYSVDHK